MAELEENQNILNDEFSPKVRNIIIELLRKGSISAENNSKNFNTLLLNKDLIKSYLRNINVNLVIDEQGFAFIRNLHRDDEPMESLVQEYIDESENVPDSYLIPSRTLTMDESITVLVLRKFYHERINSGESMVVIDHERLLAMIEPYSKDHSSSTRTIEKLNGILSRLQERKLVKKMNSEEGDRFVISPLIRYMIDAKFLETLLEKYREKALKHNISLNDELKED